jgi:hypothetical protein
MKALVIGNSQVGALRMAAEDHPRGAAFDFLSLPGGNGPRLVFDGQTVRPPEETGMVKARPETLAQGVDLAAYDLVVFSALGLSAPRAGNGQHLLNRYRVAGFGAAGAAGEPAVSRGFMAEMIAAALARMPAAQSLRALAGRFSGPVVVQPFPIPNALLQDSGASPRPEQRCDLPARYGAALWPFMGWYMGAQHGAMAALVASCGDHVTLLDYPDPDWLAAGFTPAEYAQGRDCWHMNAAYGARVLDQALAVAGQGVAA